MKISQKAKTNWVANVLLFFPYMLAFFICCFAGVAASGTAEHSAWGIFLTVAVFLGLLSGLAGMVALLLGKRKLAIICFTIMVLPAVLAVFMIPTLPTDSIREEIYYLE